MIKNAVGNPKLKAETFKARFLEAGVVAYQDEQVLIRPENLMAIALKFKGAKVIIDHKEVTAANASEIVGYINNIWKGEDGWAWCDFTVNNEEAIELINKGYSVSCAYLPVASGSGGAKNAVPYDREIIDIVEDDEITHLAIVENPRYEDAIILKNSIKNKMKNIFKFTSKKEVKENSAEVSEMELESAAFEVDGVEVPLASLMSAYKNAKEEEKKEEAKKEAKVNADDEIDVDGEMVKVSEMVKAFKAKKNAEDEEKKNAEDKEEKEKKENEDKDEEKKKEAKKNSEDAIALKNAKANFENSVPVENSKIVTESQRFALGALAYGEPQKTAK